jgi:hypothetical protein
MSLAALLAGGPALAGCPDQFHSSVPSCVVVCPAGDIEFTVIVRFPSNIPTPGTPVVLDFMACPGFLLSPRNGTEAYQSDSTGRFVWMYSDQFGTAAFRVRGGGGSGGTVVVSTCNSILPNETPEPGIPLGSRPLVAADQDGDLLVSAEDVQRVTDHLGTNDVSVDFNCDGVVSATDVGIARSHLGHSGGIPLLVKRNTWGSLKFLYR